jgi:hypothetical protein
MKILGITLKWPQQGDSLSPMFLSIVTNMLAVLIARDKEDGHVGGLIPRLVEGSIHLTICQ